MAVRVGVGVKVGVGLGMGAAALRAFDGLNHDIIKVSNQDYSLFANDGLHKQRFRLTLQKLSL